ncbi:ndufa6 NADH-ubiquinone oxidoreductase subunit [Sporothrix epigloea]|uniref:Ndufa6 NADH-ubiquinone oxidoreductase subunit n=1 Tax=Sporothrix epigloea TaxID=1892477 RepID=A0ABP0DKM4_9PEZI
MAILPTEFARVTRQCIDQAPEIQTMYSVPQPVSAVRTRMRQEFERHRFVNKLPVVDVLLFQSNADFQETMNFWRQTNHIMAYFKEESFKKGPKLPSSFIEGFLEGRN